MPASIALRSARGGLTRAEAERRLREHGPNELQGARRASPWALLLEQFRNVLIIILLIAVALSAALGEGVEAVAIAVIVLFAVVLGFVQEYRAERSMEALREMAAPTATVLRDGEEIEVPARELVPGDMILLYAGDRVPADARLVEAVNLRLEEAPLTGESVPVEKQTAPTTDEEPSVGDRTSMVYAGTAVTYGRGRAVITATGMKTEFGKVARMLQDVVSGRTPLTGGPREGGQGAGPRRAGRRGRHRGRRPAARAAVRRDVHLRDRPGGRGRPRGPARGRHHLAGHRRAAHGAA